MASAVVASITQSLFPDFRPKRNTDIGKKDPLKYTILRRRASDLAIKRNKCFNQARIAIERGHQLGSEMDAFNWQAASIIFQYYNCNRSLDWIDLHGLYVYEAEEFVKCRLLQCAKENIASLRVIVGKGIHSRDRIGKLKPAIMKLFWQVGLTCVTDKSNAGMLYVDLKSNARYANSIKTSSPAKNIVAKQQKPNTNRLLNAVVRIGVQAAKKYLRRFVRKLFP